LGLQSADGTRLVPIDDPNLAPYKPDFHEAANDAIALRPELMLARQDLKFRQLDLMLQKNLRRPDLRAYASYDVAGLGTRIGGRTNDLNPDGTVTPGNALGSFVDNRFNSWTFGLRLDMPLGFRDANGLVRQAQLNMTRSYVQLRDAEMKTIEYLAFQHRRVIQAHAEIGPARAERESLQRYLYRIREVIRIGAAGPGGFQQFFLSYLTVQQQLAAAIAAEARAIADYNTALASFEFAKGTIQQYNNVTLGDGPLPPWVQKRAADHIRERTEAAIKLREAPCPPQAVALGGHPIAPAGGTNSVLNLPLFGEKGPDGTELNPPRPVDPKQPMDPNVAPEPRPRPGFNPFGARRPLPGATDPLGVPRPLPTFGAGANNPDDYFKQDGRAPTPLPLPGARPYLGVNTNQPTGTVGGPNDYFKQDGRVVTPPPPPGTPPGAIGIAPPVPNGTGTNPEDFFKSDGRVTLPPPPKKPGEPAWGPSEVAPAPNPAPAPAPLPPVTTTPPIPSAGTVAPLPPIIPPTLPPVPSVPGGE
jgi:hypothetical protein